MKSSSAGKIKCGGKTTSHAHSKSAQLGTAAPRAISKSQITAPYLRNHIYQLSAPEIGSSLSCALCSSSEKLFICDYSHPLNKRCLCLRSKVLTDSELLRFFREKSIEGRKPYLRKVAGGGLLQREGWKCCRWEIWDKTSNFSDTPYHTSFLKGIHTEMRSGIDFKCWTLRLTHGKFWPVVFRKDWTAAKFGVFDVAYL